MDREHRHTEFGSRFHRSGYGVWDIVQLEIKKDLAAGVDQFGDNLWALGCEELKTDFVEANRITKLIDDFLCIDSGGHVQGDNQPVFWGGHAGILARISVSSAAGDG